MIDIININIDHFSGSFYSNVNRLKNRIKIIYIYMYILRARKSARGPYITRKHNTAMSSYSFPTHMLAFITIMDTHI